MSKPIKALGSDRSGAVAMIAGLTMPLLIGGMALAIDGSLLYVHQNRLQTAADAAALGGLMRLPDGEDEAIETAIALADSNLPLSGGGSGGDDGGDNDDNDDDDGDDDDDDDDDDDGDDDDDDGDDDDDRRGRGGSGGGAGAGASGALAAADVVIGTWQPSTRTFTAGGSTPNAVRTTTRMTAASGHPAKFFLAPILGLFGANLTASSTAAISSVTTNGDCRNYDPTAGTNVQSTNITTLGEGGPPARYRQADGHPLVRLDNAYNGPADITIQSTSGILKTLTYHVPRRGQFFIVLDQYNVADLPAGGNVTFKITAAPGPFRTGVHTWSNRIRDVPPPPPDQCIEFTPGETVSRALLVG